MEVLWRCRQNPSPTSALDRATFLGSPSLGLAFLVGVQRCTVNPVTTPTKQLAYAGCSSILLRGQAPHYP